MLILILSGCVFGRCGDYKIANTLASDGAYNGDWFETCGETMGTSGSWNLYDDGNAGITFSFDARGDRSWAGSDVEVEVFFPNTLLVPDTTITVDGLSGWAALNPCVDCVQDIAGLASGSIEVLGGWEGTDPCAEDDGPVMDLAWTLEFGGGAGPTYTLETKDAVRFSTFLSEPCDTVW